MDPSARTQSLTFPDLLAVFSASAFIVDEHGHVPIWNRFASEVFGVTTAGQPLQEWLGTDPDELRDFLTRASRSRGMLSWGADLTTNAGRRLRCELRACRIPSGLFLKPVLLLVVQPKSTYPTGFSALNERISQLRREVAARRRAENTLRELYREITAPLPADDRFIQILRSGCRRFGMRLALLTRQQLDHAEVLSCTHSAGPELAPGIPIPLVPGPFSAGVFEELQRTGWRIDAESPLAGYWAEPAIATHLTCNGEHYGTLVFAGPGVAYRAPDELGLDWLRLTAKWLASELARMKVSEEHAALELRMQTTQKLESLGTLAGGIAHDFNNLLVGVLGTASAILETLPSSSPLHREVSQIHLSAQRAAELAQSLLTYSGRAPITITTLDLRDEVEDMQSLIKLGGKVAIEIVRTPYPVWVRGDSGRLRQVILNLITNAVDAVRENRGRIRVETGTRLYGDHELSMARVDSGMGVGEYAFIEVADEGYGMHAATEARIFDPFFTTKPDGHGLGMASVVGIVRGHSGVIHLETAPGRGTCIRVAFPVAEPVAAGGEPDPDVRTLDTSKRMFERALLVDDNEVVRRVGARLLGSLEIEVVPVTGGAQALDEVGRSQGRFDVIILDLSMPGIGGEETLRHLREQHPELPVLLCSGNPADAEAIATADPFTHVLAKPYDRTSLGAALSELAVQCAAVSHTLSRNEGENHGAL